MEHFYLGAHHSNWLARPRRVRLFVSRASLHKLKKLPRASALWGQDSSGFTTLNKHGYWPFGAKQYAAETKRFRDEIGQLDHAAIQDWMCEPFVLKKTGLSIAEHQRRSVQSYEDLLAEAPEIPWMPVLQGWRINEYLEHVDLYNDRGHDLRRVPIVGVGSVCRRQGSLEGAAIMRQLADLDLPLHGFGFKVDGLVRVHDRLKSADSMSWAKAGWKRPNKEHEHYKRSLLPGNFGKRGCADDCASCFDYAMDWYDSLMRRIEEAKMEAAA